MLKTKQICYFYYIILFFKIGMRFLLRFTSLLSLIVFTANLNWVFSQNIESLCQPDIINHSHGSYKAHRQNWDIAQNPTTKFMYFANSKGLLEYDGTHWTTYELPSKQIVRSVICDKKGKIWTGALGEFGYWVRDAQKKLIYHSLRGSIKDASFGQEEIWHILDTPEGILFQSFAFIYVLKKNGTIIQMHNPGNVLYVFGVQGRNYVQVLEKGLYQILGDSFVKIPQSDFLGQESVHCVLAGGTKNSLLIGTNRGVYIFDKQGFRVFNNVLQKFVSQNQLNAGMQLPNGQYVFGTILNGLVITDIAGNILNNVNQKNGLQNNTVLSMKNDIAGNIWLGLDKGISMLSLSSAFKYYEDINGDLGTVFDAAVFQNKLYLATNHGVFYNNLTKSNRIFTLLPNTQSQTWDLEVIDKQLFCGHNNGTFSIDNQKAMALSDVTGGLVIKKLLNQPNYLLQGTYTQLCVYKKNTKGLWVFANTIAGFTAPIKQLEEGNSGEIFVNTLNKGIYRLWLDNNMKQVVRQMPVKLAHLPKNLTKIKQKIILTTNETVQEFDTKTQDFVPIKENFGTGIIKLFPINNSIWAIKNNGDFGKINLDGTWTELPLKQGAWVSDYENMLTFGNTFLFCKENGFSVLHQKDIARLLGKKGSKPIIHLKGNMAAAKDHNGLVLSYNQNNLHFGFSATDYASSVKYSYWLENAMGTWSAFGEATEKEFSNLPPAYYTLHLKTNNSAQEAIFNFEINNPWYWNWLSKFCYLLAAAALGFYMFRLHNLRLAAQNKKLKKEKEEELKLQIEQNNQEIIRLRNEQLEADVVRKSEELANSTMQLIKKNELLKKLKTESLQIEKQDKTGSMSQIIKLIDHNIASSTDWQVFEQNFNRVHERFFKKLLEQHPALSPGDLKLSAYLRMNLSSKEIAQLLNITLRSVELKRYRLRKKLNLDSENNLVEWLMGEI
jgi:DNA-binding CsgD family transcriptional regulator